MILTHLTIIPFTFLKRWPENGRLKVRTFSFTRLAKLLSVVNKGVEKENIKITLFFNINTMLSFRQVGLSGCQRGTMQLQQVDFL